MNALSICSGAGGFDYAAQWLLGWRVKGYVEIGDHPQRCLAQRIEDGVFHRAPIFTDLRVFNGEGYAESYRGVAQVVFGGPPCQPFTSAGKMLGADDPRDLSEVVLETLRLVEPQYFFMENSTDAKGPKHAAHWGRFLAGLAALGYDAQWDCLRACDVGAPHRRDRLWLVASLPEWEVGPDAGGGRFEGEGPLRAPQEQPEARHLGGADGLDDASDPFGSNLRHQQRRISGTGREGAPGARHFGTARLATDAGRERREGGIWSRTGRQIEEILPGPGGERRSTADTDDRRQQELSQRDCGPIAGEQASLWGDAVRSTHRNADEERLEQRPQPSGRRQEPPQGAGPWTIESFPPPVAHGLAGRRQQLAASGEGVVPLVAAVAWLRLTRPLILEISGV